VHAREPAFAHLWSQWRLVLSMGLQLGDGVPDELLRDLADRGYEETPLPFAAGVVVTAAEAAEYSYLLRYRPGQPLCPVVLVQRSAGRMLVAWPGATGPHYGGLHVQVRVA